MVEAVRGQISPQRFEHRFSLRGAFAQRRPSSLQTGWRIWRVWFLLATTGLLRDHEILDESTSRRDIASLRQLALAYAPALSFAYRAG
jgi:hypothetical protein